MTYLYSNHHICALSRHANDCIMRCISKNWTFIMLDQVKIRMKQMIALNTLSFKSLATIIWRKKFLIPSILHWAIDGSSHNALLTYLTLAVWSGASYFIIILDPGTLSGVYSCCVVWPHPTSPVLSWEYIAIESNWQKKSPMELPRVLM